MNSTLISCLEKYRNDIVLLLHTHIQTDDKGVFSCSLSEEFALIAEAFKLSEQQLYDLSYDAIDYIFAGDDIKNKLQNEWKVFHSRHSPEFGGKSMVQ